MGLWILWPGFDSRLPFHYFHGAKMSELTPKGVRDFLPEEKIIRDKIINTLKEVFERYGYNPLETPGLERIDVLASKYAGGEEILKEIFKLKDQGNRDLGLRYDLTVPFSRVIAMNPNLKMPFKRYAIQNVWRDGPIKLGRYREFIQADCDIAGCSSVNADAECLALAKSVFELLGLDVVIEVNSRKLLNAILNYCKIDYNKFNDTILSLDKLEKIGKEGVEEELTKKGIDNDKITKLLDIVSVKGKNEEVLKKIKEKIEDSENKSNLDKLYNNVIGKSGIDELNEILSLTKSFGVEIKITPTLARGLAYYTGPIYEVFLKSGKLTSSLAGGGRYDKMICQLIEAKEDVPATGISFGVDTISDALKLEGKAELRKTVVDVYVVPIGDVMEKAISLVQTLRKNGVKADIDLMGKGISKNLSYANSYGIKYVAFLGQKEIEVGKAKLRNMEKGEEILLSVEEIVKLLK